MMKAICTSENTCSYGNLWMKGREGKAENERLDQSSSGCEGSAGRSKGSRWGNETEKE